ncbi:MAG: alanine racemase [Erysipelotrichaceae bacterium]|nr:alanine racemase [Erysipelotrichaceae bacterium]
MYRNTYLLINTDSYRANVNTLRHTAGKELIAVIKANAYGVGDIEAAALAMKEGVRFFAVSSIEEAIHLRKRGVRGEILILGYVDLNFLDLVKEYNLSLVTVSKDYFSSIPNLTGVKIHLKIDTGMHRIGILPEQAPEVLASLNIRGADICGIMTHYARSDEKDEVYTDQQYRRFRKVIEELHYPFRYIHTCNTDASINFDDPFSTHVRCGLGLCGYSSFDSMLKPALALKSEVINCKRVERGEPVSYGGHYVSDGEGYILTLPIGYADGINRKYTGNDVYIEGEYAPIVGSICMDQCMIHTQRPYPVGTPVEFFGQHIALEKMAETLGTIPYEILTGLSDRVSRRYIDNEGNVLKESTPRLIL